VASKDAELFAPLPAYRFRGVEGPLAAPYDPVAGQNPPTGASIHYWLKAAAKDELDISILDATGKTVRTFKGPAKAGINRVWWDLLFDKTKEVKLRNSPLYAPYVKVADEGMTAPGVGRFSMPAPPGTYAVKLKVGDRELSRPLTVLQDPNSGGSEEHIRAATELAASVVADANNVVDMINATESVRRQLGLLDSQLAGDSKNEDVRKTAEALGKKLVAFEENLFQMRQTGRGQDVLRWPWKLAEQLLYLAGDVTGSDFAPTSQQREVARLLHEQALGVRKQFDQLLGSELAAFNTMLVQRKLAGVVMPHSHGAP
jgi:hypothetical protein